MREQPAQTDTGSKKTGGSGGDFSTEDNARSSNRDWESRQIRWVGEFVGGGTPKKSNESFWDGEIPWVSPKDMKTFKISDTQDKITQEGLQGSTTSTVPEGAVLMVTRSGILRRKLPVGVAQTDVALNQDLKAIVPYEDIDGSFLAYWIRGKEHQLLTLWKKEGTTVESLETELIKQTEIRLPSKAQQKSIVTFLDHKTSTIKKLIAKKKRLISLLEEKRTALITRAVTKGLGSDVPMKDSGVEWLGEIPKHWETAKIRWVAEMQSGHTPTRSNDQYWSQRDGYPWVSLNDSTRVRQQDYISETEYRISKAGLENSSARILPERAVVFSRDATVGLSAITDRPMAVSQHFVAWLCGDEIVPEFLLQVMKAMRPELERLTAGATISTIGMPDIASLVTPLPPVEEQKRIVNQLNAKRRGLQDIEHLSGKLIDLLSEYRSALITAAVTGKIDIRDHAA